MNAITDRDLKDALDTLLVCNRIREITGHPSPVTREKLSGIYKLATCFTKAGYISGGLQGLGMKRIITYLLTMVVLRLLLHRWKVWRAFSVSSVAVLLFTKLRRPWLPTTEINGYVLATDKERPLIRACLLMRILGMYGACVEILMKRYISGLPSIQTRYWLAFFLRENGAPEAAELLSPICSQADTIAPIKEAPSAGHAQRVKTPGLKYGLVMTSMFDTDVFRASLLSLLESDFRGEIVVAEEGHRTEKACEEFCKQHRVKYVKNPEWSGNTVTVNYGIRQLPPATDIIIYAHNDVLWPPRWFSQLSHAWDKVHHLNKVGMINMGYYQFVQNSADNVLHTLFVNHDYEELNYLLTLMNNMPSPAMLVENVQNRDAGRLFGLARDPWTDDPKNLRAMTGRFSVGASFPRKIWEDIGGFDPDLKLGLDAELFYYCFQKHLWHLWINNTPLIHMRSTDFYNLTPEEVNSFIEKLNAMYKNFENKYGWDILHFEFTYLAETSVIHYDEIVNAVNELRFDDIEYIFGEFWQTLRRKRLPICEITQCPNRKTCKYP